MDAELIQRYLADPAAVRQAIEGLSAAEIDSTPIAGTWSIRQVICHLADAEILYADRLKRVNAEHQPTLMKVKPEQFLAALGVPRRDLQNELQLIETVRRQIGRILAVLQPAQFERIGIHSADGPLTLRTILQRVTDHIPHHLAFVEEKKRRIVANRT